MREEYQEVSSREAKSIQENIKRRVPPPKKIDVKLIPVMEYTDKYGNPMKFIAYGHVSLTDFAANVWNKFCVKPNRCIHTFHKKDWGVSEITGVRFSYMRQCKYKESNSAPITVGTV